MGKYDDLLESPPPATSPGRYGDLLTSPPPAPRPGGTETAPMDFGSLLQQAQRGGRAMLEQGRLPGARKPSGTLTREGMARAAGLGALRGATALPQLAGQTLRALRDRLSPEGQAILDASPLGHFVTAGELLETAGRGIAQRAEQELGGPEVRDTATERLLGSIGEVAGSVASGGPLRGLAGMGARAVRSVPSIVGAGLGAHLAREQEASPWVEAGASLVGGGLGQAAAGGLGLTARGAGGVVRGLSQPRMRDVNLVTRRVIDRVRDLRKQEAALGTRYRAVEEAADAASVTFATESLKSKAQDILGRLVGGQGGKARRLLKEITELPDTIPLRRFRDYQRAANEISYNVRRGGKKNWAARRLSGAVQEEMNEAASREMMRQSPLASEFVQLNREWGDVQRQMQMADLLVEGSRKLLGYRGKYRRLLPNNFEEWIKRRQNREILEELYGQEHVDNMLKLVSNHKRIPDEVAMRIAGPVDAERQAIVDILTSLGRISTAPIGSIRWRGRRIGEALTQSLSSLADERRGVAMLRAFEDPEVADGLLRVLMQPTRGRGVGFAARLAAPAALERPETPDESLRLAREP